MSERKVLNKYYPPDFDPAKIPRMKLAKNRQYTVRLMAPFNMRCVTCGEYIYKGKKFNARKEDVEDQTYLGIRIYRFYIKCTRCLQEISFKTDPRNTDYEIEAGATRNFMALKLAEEQAKKEEDELREEEANNPMKLLENRTEQSRNEIELLESLEELKDLNRRQQSVDYETMLRQYNLETEQEREERLKQLDEEYIKTVKFDSDRKNVNQIKRVAEEEIVEIDEKDMKLNDGFKKETGLLKSESLKLQKEDVDVDEKHIKNETNEKIMKIEKQTQLKSKDISIGGFSNNNKVMLKNLIIKKKVTTETTPPSKPPAPPPSKPPAPPSSIISSTTIDNSSTKQNTNIQKNNGNALTMLSGYDDDEDSSE